MKVRKMKRMMTKHKRIGRFLVTIEFLEKHIDDVQNIMCQCVVIQTNTNYLKDCIEYIAISNHFDEIEIGEMIPEYRIEDDSFFSADENLNAVKTISIKFVRI